MDADARLRAEEVDKLAQWLLTYYHEGNRWEWASKPLKERLRTEATALLDGPVTDAVAQALANVQHVCTKCGYIAVTQSVTTEQIVAQAVKERDEARRELRLMREGHPTFSDLRLQLDVKVEENARLKEEIEDTNEAYRSVIEEACAGGVTYETDDRLHCTCVPHLREGVARLRAALQRLYDETADYISINHLGDVHHNGSMKMAREALRAGGEGEQ